MEGNPTGFLTLWMNVDSAVGVGKRFPPCEIKILDAVNYSDAYCLWGIPEFPG